MAQPPGFDDGTGRVFLLKKALYGTKQAPRGWIRHLSEFLENIGFLESKCDKCLFIRRRSNMDFIFISIYVDDLLMVPSSESNRQWIVNELSAQFKIHGMGTAKWLLGNCIQ
jgi:hypothetical protein